MCSAKTVKKKERERRRRRGECGNAIDVSEEEERKQRCGEQRKGKEWE